MLAVPATGAPCRFGYRFDESLYGEVEFAGYERNLPGVLDRIFARDEGVDGFFFTTHILALEAFRYFP